MTHKPNTVTIIACRHCKKNLLRQYIYCLQSVNSTSMHVIIMWEQCSIYLAWHIHVVTYALHYKTNRPFAPRVREFHYAVLRKMSSFLGHHKMYCSEYKNPTAYTFTYSSVQLLLYFRTCYWTQKLLLIIMIRALCEI